MADLTALPAMVPARELYAGRAFSLARESADLIAADFAIISAGLGWVTADTLVPSYDLTAADDARLSTAEWWGAVSRGPYSSAPEAEVAGRPLVLACVASRYAAFFADALSAVDPANLRIFGAGVARHLPASMSASIVPYDDRLNALTPGTRSDFAQRALRHFVGDALHRESLECAKESVERALRGKTYAAKPPGRGATDAELIELIRATLAKVPMSRTAMLRHFRVDLRIACEQSRFKALFSRCIAE